MSAILTVDRKKYARLANRVVVKAIETEEGYDHMVAATCSQRDACSPDGDKRTNGQGPAASVRRSRPGFRGSKRQALYQSGKETRVVVQGGGRSLHLVFWAEHPDGPEEGEVVPDCLHFSQKKCRAG